LLATFESVTGEVFDSLLLNFHVYWDVYVASTGDYFNSRHDVSIPEACNLDNSASQRMKSGARYTHKMLYLCNLLLLRGIIETYKNVTSYKNKLYYVHD
jgi:hypothetical protein